MQSRTHENYKRGHCDNFVEMNNETTPQKYQQQTTPLLPSSLSALLAQITPPSPPPFCPSDLTSSPYNTNDSSLINIHTDLPSHKYSRSYQLQLVAEEEDLKKDSMICEGNIQRLTEKKVRRMFTNPNTTNFPSPQQRQDVKSPPSGPLLAQKAPEGMLLQAPIKRRLEEVDSNDINLFTLEGISKDLHEDNNYLTMEQHLNSKNRGYGDNGKENVGENNQPKLRYRRKSLGDSSDENSTLIYEEDSINVSSSIDQHQIFDLNMQDNDDNSSDIQTKNNDNAQVQQLSRIKPRNKEQPQQPSQEIKSTHSRDDDNSLIHRNHDDMNWWSENSSDFDTASELSSSLTLFSNLNNSNLNNDNNSHTIELNCDNEDTITQSPRSSRALSRSQHYNNTNYKRFRATVGKHNPVQRSMNEIMETTIDLSDLEEKESIVEEKMNVIEAKGDVCCDKCKNLMVMVCPSKKNPTATTTQGSDGIWASYFHYLSVSSNSKMKNRD